MIEISQLMKTVLAVLAIIHGGDQINRHETICLAKAVYFESRDQDLTTQISIASFMKQFAERNDMTICEEVYESPGVRYPWVVHDKEIREPDAWERAVIVSALTLRGYAWHDVKNATHFLTPSIIQKLPSWYDPKKVVYRIGDFEYLRLPDYR